MPVSPICLVQDGGPFNPTVNGVDVGPGNTISIKLNDSTGVVDWFLEITGTDELSTAPALVGVDIVHHVTTPATVVTFTFPNATGRALLFASTVTGPGGPLTTTFSIFTLTAAAGARVGASGEVREGSFAFGWVTKTNPLIRAFTAAPIIFDGGTPKNVRTARPINQSPINNTKNGITNLSSDTTGTDPGAVADFATISGGDQNDINVNSLYGTIGGGFNNSIKGQGGTVGGGQNNQAGSEFDAFGTGTTVGGGSGNKARGQDSAIGGGTSNEISPLGVQGFVGGGQNASVTAQNGTVLNGYFCQATGGFSTVINGDGAIASAFHSVAGGRAAKASRPFQQAYGDHGLGYGGQWSRLFVAGQAASILVSSTFTLEDGLAYLVRVYCVLNKIGALQIAAFERTMLVHAAAGVAVIDQDIPGVNNAALNMGSGYTLVMSAVGPAIVATVNALADSVNVSLCYEWIEQNDAV